MQRESALLPVRVAKVELKVGKFAARVASELCTRQEQKVRAQGREGRSRNRVSLRPFTSSTGRGERQLTRRAESSAYWSANSSWTSAGRWCASAVEDDATVGDGWFPFAVAGAAVPNWGSIVGGSTRSLRQVMHGTARAAQTQRRAADGSEPDSRRCQASFHACLRGYTQSLMQTRVRDGRVLLASRGENSASRGFSVLAKRA